jgi:hypothetical protein
MPTKSQHCVLWLVWLSGPFLLSNYMQSSVPTLLWLVPLTLTPPHIACCLTTLGVWYFFADMAPLTGLFCGLLCALAFCVMCPTSGRSIA